MRGWWLAILVACGSPPPPAAPVENKAPLTPVPAKVEKRDPLGTFTTSTRPQAATTGTGSVAGKLTTTMGEPLVGATVVFDGPALVGERVHISDENGQFVLDGFPAGRYRISIYYGDHTVQRDFDIETDRVTDLAMANWDEAFVRAPIPEPALPEPRP